MATAGVPCPASISAVQATILDSDVVRSEPLHNSMFRTWLSVGGFCAVNADPNDSKMSTEPTPPMTIALAPNSISGFSEPSNAQIFISAGARDTRIASRMVNG